MPTSPQLCHAIIKGFNQLQYPWTGGFDAPQFTEYDFNDDGRNDNRGLDADDNYDPTRDWFYQNVRLRDALVEQGYDVNYSWGIGVHSHDMGGAMLPEMMRWLWRDQPVSVEAVVVLPDSSLDVVPAVPTVQRP